MYKQRIFAAHVGHGDGGRADLRTADVQRLRRGVRRRVELRRRLHRWRLRLPQRPQLLGPVVDAGRGPRRRGGLGGQGRLQRRLDLPRVQPPELGGGHAGTPRAPSSATPTASTTWPSTTTRATTRRSAPGTGSRTPAVAAATDPPAGPVRLRGQRGAVQPDVPEPELLLHLQRPDRRAERLPRLRQDRQRHRTQAGGRGVPGQRQPRDRRPGPHRRAEHRQLPALLRQRPALRLPRRPGRLLRPRADPAELELQLQGRRRRARHRPAGQPLPGAERRRRGLEDRPLVLEHPERPRHHDRRTTPWSTAPASARPSAASTAAWSATAETRPRCRAASTTTSGSSQILGTTPGGNLYC